MLKYDSYSIVFSEIPDEITLAFSITNCPNNCEGCHSQFLREDYGTPLLKNLEDIVGSYEKYITCVLFLGVGRNPGEINIACKFIKEHYGLKTAVYTGKNEYSHTIEYLDYLKIGEYIESLGGLDIPTTNQKMFEIKDGKIRNDITYKMQTRQHNFV